MAQKDPLIQYNTKSSIPVTHIDILHTLKTLDYSLIWKLDQHAFYPKFIEQLFYFIQKTGKLDTYALSQIVKICTKWEVSDEFQRMVIFKVFKQIKQLSLAEITPILPILMKKGESEMRFRLRIKFRDLILKTNVKGLDLPFQDALWLIRSMRNFAKEYEVWLKLDRIIMDSIKFNDIDHISDTKYLFDLINWFAYTEVQNIEAWQYYVHSFIKQMTSEKIGIIEITGIWINFKSVSIKAPELYEMIVAYFKYKKFTYKDLEEIKSPVRVVKFGLSVGQMYGSCDDEYLFKQLSLFLERNYKVFNEFETSRALDLFKFFVNWQNAELKEKLIDHIESFPNSFK